MPHTNKLSQINTYILPNEGNVRLPTVIAVTGLSRSTVYSMVKNGSFPPPRRIAKRIIIWEVRDIRKFLNDGKWGQSCS